MGRPVAMTIFTPAALASCTAEKTSGVFAEGCCFYKLVYLFFLGAFLGDLTEEERKRFEALPDEDKHRCIAQNLISHQDDKLWADDIGISQLEGRIVTKNFQG